MMCANCPPPGVETIRMLQCQGLKANAFVTEICHNSYFYESEIMRCVDLCRGSLRCFTNICMPREAGVEDINNLLFDNNLELTLEEKIDMLHSLIERFFGIVDP